MSQFAVVETTGGAKAILDSVTGEVMHPVVGPLVEPRSLYLVPSKLDERLAVPTARPLVLYDVGLGAGSTAIAAWQTSELRKSGRPLHIESFDHTSAALSLALEHPGDFALEGPAGVAAATLVRAGECASARTAWRYWEGDLPDTLARPAEAADIVYWDPFSPPRNPLLWTVAAFRALRVRCKGDTVVLTYSGATRVRAALLLAGFFVGVGRATATGRPSTVAAGRLESLAAPLDDRWLLRVARSSAPFPPDAPSGALDRLRGHSQFSPSRL